MMPDESKDSLTESARVEKEKPRGFFATRTGIVLVCAFCLTLVVGAALLWYPPLTSAGYAPVSPSQPFFQQTAQDKVDINTATAAQLAVLPGIGQVKAQAIVDWREENGPFAQAEDLLQVSGIGEKTLEGLLPFISL